ncbi:MAG TPA: hypothetical protein VFJ47_09545, partial [Terriglobales bacterium]|nr:hypothetical protein [Terriglobales bacterium]
TKTGKIYVSDDKMRFESQSQGAGNVAMVWDVGRQTRYILMPERRMYMDYSPVMGAKMPEIPYLHPSDINDACPEWHKMAVQMNHADKWGTCRKVGNDTVNGRSAVKYEGTSNDGKSSQIWIDSKLRYVTKYQQKDGNGMELRNIEEVAQPASLFVVPPGYQKFDMPGMGMRQR